MKRELEQQIFERWPQWFDRTNPQHSCMCFGFECGDGWFEIIKQLCEDIDEELKAHPPEYAFCVLQVKEKFGGLRFYTGSASEKVYDHIRRAEHLSVHTCEECGAAGKLRGGGWIKCLCDEHAKGKPPLDDELRG